MNEIERLRQSHMPARVRVLFVGESAPANGDNFFYKRRSGVHAEFRKLLEPHIGGGDNFLEAFKAKGFYLDDLVLTPVNYLSKAERRAHSMASIPSLAERIAAYQPEWVISFMLGIRKYTADAIAASGHACRHHAVPFLGNGQQGRFHKAMNELLPSII